MNGYEKIDMNPNSPITPDDASRTQVRLEAATAQAPSTRDGLVDHLNEPHWYDGARAGFFRENIAGQLAISMGASAAFPSDPDEPVINPFTYFAQNREGYKDLEVEVASGVFDDVRSIAAFKRKAFVTRINKENLETLERSGVGGAVAGMAASLFDITSVASLGAFSKLSSASRLVNAGRGAAVAAGDAAIQEIALQNMDPTRKAEESFMAIGSSAFLGAGLGSLFKHLPPDSRLMPGHPENPLHPDNLGKDIEVIEHRIGQTPEEGVTLKADSIGAMRARDALEDSEIARGTGIGGAVQDLSEKVLAHGTPVARMRHYEGPGRSVLTQLVDMGGRLTKAMARGDAHAPEAESLRTVYIQKARDVQNDVLGIFRQANLDMGQSALETAARGQLSTYTLGKVDTNSITQKVFFKGVFDEMSARMMNNVKAQQEIMADLKAHGLDDAKASQVYGRIREAADRNKKYLDELRDDAIRTGLMDPELNLGDAYGLPVQYVRSEINRDPRAFENTLLKLLADQPDPEWLKGSGHLMDAEGKELKWEDIQKDTGKLNEVLKDWRGDTEQRLAAEAAASFASSYKNMLKIADEFDTIKHGLAVANKEKKVKSVAAMRAQVRAGEAAYHGRAIGYAMDRVEKAEARLGELRQDYPDLVDLAEYAQRQFEATGQRIDAAVEPLPAAIKAESEAKSLVDALRGEKKQLTRGTPEHAEITAKINEAVQAKRNASLELDEARGALDDAARAQRNASGLLEEAVREVERFRKDTDEALKGPGYHSMQKAQADHIEVLKERLSKAEDARRQMVEEWRQVRKGLAVSRKELRSARSQVRKTGRVQARIERGTPLSQYVEQVTTALRGQDKFPAGLLMDQVAETGRLKERRFKWTPELWKELGDRGFVETDTASLIDRYARDMGGRLAIQKSIGHQDIEQVLKEVRDHYDDLVTKATDEKAKKRYERLRDLNLRDVRASWDRILGKHEIQDDTAVSWMASKLGTMGFLRFVGGFPFSAISDLATAMFSTPGFVRGFRAAHVQYAEILERASVGDPDAAELKMILSSFESGAHLATSIRALGGGSARDHVGFGSGMTKEITGTVDKVLNLAADRANVLSGLAAISDGVRRPAGLVQLANIQKWTKDYANISASNKADLATLGIGRVEAERMAELFKKHGKRFDSGLVDPGMSKWITEPDGDHMADVLNSALVKAQQRASYTQGFGHMPLMMDSAYGKLFFQFQSYAFQYTNNFLLAGIQKGAVTGDYLRFASTMGIAMAAASVVSTGRAYLRGDDPKQWDNAKWANEIVTRSGILGWSQPYADSAVKLFGPGINAALGANVLQPSSKFQQNGWLESLMGPWAGTLKLVSETSAAAARGEFTQAGEKALRLVPLNQQIQALNLILEGMNQ